MHLWGKGVGRRGEHVHAVDRSPRESSVGGVAGAPAGRVPSEASRGKQRQAEASRGKQRPFEAHQQVEY